jgi:hypothetical protein
VLSSPAFFARVRASSQGYPALGRNPSHCTLAQAMESWLATCSLDQEERLAHQRVCEDLHAAALIARGDPFSHIVERTVHRVAEFARRPLARLTRREAVGCPFDEGDRLVFAGGMLIGDLGRN